MTNRLHRTRSRDVREAPRIVESFVVPYDEQAPVQRSPFLHSFPRLPQGTIYRVGSVPLPLLRGIVITVVMAAVFAFSAFVAPSLFVESVATTIFLHPQKGEQTHLVAVAGSPNENPALLRVRSVENTASALAPTTGVLSHLATSAQGVLTFYNTATQYFSLPVGVDIVASNGIHVVTLAPITLPASPNFPQFVTATVAARVATTGAVGNLATGAIETQCPALYCGASRVTITNTTPFTGGQDSQTIHVVSQADVERVQNPLRASLNTKTPGMLLAGNQKGEKVVNNTLTCSPSSMTVDPSVGTQATQVRVTVSMRCQEEVYQPDTVIARALTQAFPPLSQADDTLYVVAQNASITALEKPDAQGAVIFQVTVFRRWEARISSSLVARLAAFAGGKTPDEVRRYLRTNRTIGDVSIEQRFLGGILLPFPCALAHSPHNVSIREA